MWLYVDGTLQASADGPDGDVSYPDNGVPGNFCGGPCTDIVAAVLMYKLGGAISPLLGMTQRSESAAIDTVPIVRAASSDIAPATFPRIQAFFSAALETTGALTAGVTLVASRNAGATWEPVSLTRMRAQTSAAAWRSTGGHGVLAVEAGEAVRFGLSLHREGGTADVNSIRGQIAWMGVNRAGAAPPRDLFVQP